MGGRGVIGNSSTSKFNVYERPKLPELEGSEKQVKWAKSIREKVIDFNMEEASRIAFKIEENNNEIKKGSNRIYIIDQAKHINRRVYDKTLKNKKKEQLDFARKTYKYLEKTSSAKDIIDKYVKWKEDKIQKIINK